MGQMTTKTPENMTATKLRGYDLIINEATGVTDLALIGEIEECMRHDIFHSTLDWQTRAQLHDAARLAMKIIAGVAQ